MIKLLFPMFIEFKYLYNKKKTCCLQRVFLLITLVSFVYIRPEFLSVLFLLEIGRFYGDMATEMRSISCHLS